MASIFYVASGEIEGLLGVNLTQQTQNIRRQTCRRMKQRLLNSSTQDQALVISPYSPKAHPT